MSVFQVISDSEIGSNPFNYYSCSVYKHMQNHYYSIRLQRRSIIQSIFSSDNHLTQLSQVDSIRSATMLTILLLATIALLCQCEAHSLDYDYVEARYQKPVPQRISKFYDNVNAAYNPLVKEQQSSSSHNISIEPLNTRDNVFCSYTAPDTGRVIFSLVQKETDDLVLNIGVRYTFGSEKNVLVLNSRKDGKWGEEVRPSGFDFSPNIQVNLFVSVGDAGFDILHRRY